MGTRAKWDALAVRLRGAADPFQEPEIAELWTLACEEGPRALTTFRQAGRLDDERAADLTRDLLVDALPSIVAADNPQAYFIAALTNAARSWLRKKGSAVASPAEPGARHDASHPITPAPDHALRIDMTDFLLTLSERERDVLVGVANDEDREEHARRLGITRANLDQIVSRARRRFRPEEP